MLHASVPTRHGALLPTRLDTCVPRAAVGGAPTRAALQTRPPVRAARRRPLARAPGVSAVLGASTGSLRSYEEEEEEEGARRAHPRTDLEVGLPASSLESQHCHEMLSAARAEVQRWRRQARLKPRGYDARQSLALAQGPELCCLTRGGRAAATWKLDNQDSYLAQHIPPAPGARFAAEGALVLGVFDGHGARGGEASRLVRGSVARSLAEAATGRGLAPCGGAEGGLVACGSSKAPHASPIEAALIRAFADADRNLDLTGRDFSRSGTTAVVCVVEPGRVTAAWAGDSRAVLGLAPVGGPARRQPAPTAFGERVSGRAVGTAAGYARPSPSLCKVVPLTEDHSPELERERARIFRSGGAVRQTHRDAFRRPVGPMRVCFPGTNTPGLAVSRALGDRQAASIGVSSTPEIASVALPGCAPAVLAGRACSAEGREARALCASGATPGPHHVLIVASDGLWQWMGNEAAVDIASACASAQEAADRLAEVARLRWVMHQGGAHVDDITVSVLFLPCGGGAESGAPDVASASFSRNLAP